MVMAVGVAGSTGSGLICDRTLLLIDWPSFSASKVGAGVPVPVPGLRSEKRFLGNRAVAGGANAQNGSGNAYDYRMKRNCDCEPLASAA
jgi:hypothetical protein